jgi:hypothetical protein
MDKYRNIKPWVWPALLILLSLALYSRGVFNEDTFYPDADRIAMDGIYFHDLIKDMPFADIYNYTIRYFAQYPALSIGYRMPFFQVIEGIFYLILGISMSTAKISVLFFAAFGVLFFFKLVKRIYSEQTAVFSSLLFITTPFIFRWARLPMQEIPTLTMAIASIYFFYKYVESESKKEFILFLPVFILALYTKHNALFLIPMFALYIILRKKYRLFIKKEVLVGIAVFILAMVPFAIITLKFGSFNIEQSVGSKGVAIGTFNVLGIVSKSRLGLPNLLYHLRTLQHAHLTFPVFVLSILGIILSIFKKDKRAVLFIAWIAAVYIMVTYSRGKNIRYPIYWIPAFCVLAASVIENLPFKKTKRINAFFSVIFIGVVFFQVIVINNREGAFKASGYREAARYVTENPKGHTIFFEGYANGSFIFWVRKFDDERNFIVLRGDKLLMSSVISYTNKLNIYVDSAEGMMDIFRKYGTTYVVVEEKNVSGLEILDTLRSLLKTDKFKLVKRIPAHSSGLISLKDNRAILIYERLEDASLPEGRLVLPVPTVGTTIEIDIEDLR